MASRIERAQTALTALLAALSGVTVLTNNDVPVDFVSDTTPVLNVIDGDDSDDSPRFLAANTVEIDTTVHVAGYVTADDSGDLRAARETLWRSVWNTLLANPRLADGDGSDITWDVQPGKTERALESEPGKPVAVFRLPVTLRIKASASDPAIAA